MKTATKRKPAAVRSKAAEKLSLSKTGNGATVSARAAKPVVPLKDRRLNFGDKWDYAPAPEDSKSYAIAPRHELFIDGKFTAPHSGRYFDSINPPARFP